MNFVYWLRIKGSHTSDSLYFYSHLCMVRGVLRWDILFSIQQPFSCLPVCLSSVCVSASQARRISIKFDIGHLKKTYWEFANLVINTALYMKMFVLLYQAIMGCYKSALFNRNGMRLYVCPSVAVCQPCFYYMYVCVFTYSALSRVLLPLVLKKFTIQYTKYNI